MKKRMAIMLWGMILVGFFTVLAGPTAPIEASGPTAPIEVVISEATVPFEVCGPTAPIEVVLCGPTAPIEYPE